MVTELADGAAISEILGGGWIDELIREKFMQGVAALAPAIARAEETTTTVFTTGMIPTSDRAFSEAETITIRGKQLTAASHYLGTRSPESLPSPF